MNRKFSTPLLETVSSCNQYLIDLVGVRENLRQFRRRLGSNTRIMPILKANGYGTDAVAMSRFFESEGIDIIDVSWLDEALYLRSHGIQCPLFTLYCTPQDAPQAIANKIEVAVSNREILHALTLAAEEQSEIAHVHLNVETGMGRLGCKPELAIELAQEIHSNPYLKFEGIMSHFSSAHDAKQDEFTCKQVETFQHVIQKLQAMGIDPKWKHIQNSSGAIRFPLEGCNLARIGLALFGCYPSDACKESMELVPTLSLRSHIAAIKVYEPGDTISYDRTFLVERPTRIAVLPIGYHDGLRCKGNVTIGGKRAPIVGKICMDFTMVDVTDLAGVEEGDEVVVFGIGGVSIEEFAKEGNGHLYDLMSGIGSRVERVFKG